MKNIATIDELISWGKTQEISQRNLTRSAYIVNNVSSDVLRIPMNAIMSEYRYFLTQYIIEVTMNDEELYLYQYKPKSLSSKLYNTTEYWSVLLMINNCVSKLDFNKHKIKVLNPKTIRGFVNEVLILEKIIT